MRTNPPLRRLAHSLLRPVLLPLLLALPLTVSPSPPPMPAPDWQDALYGRTFSAPRAVAEAALAVLQQPASPAGPRARLMAAAELSAAVQLLSRADQGQARSWLEAAVIAARRAEPAQPDLLVELLVLLAMDHLMQGRLDTTERLLAEASSVAAAPGAGSAASIHQGRGLLTLARGDGVGAVEHFDQALQQAHGPVQRSLLLTWKAMAQRRFARPVRGMLRSGLALLEEAERIVPVQDLPVLRVNQLVARVQGEVTLGELKQGAAHTGEIYRLFAQLAPQGYRYSDSLFANVLVQFRREDLALAERLQSQRLVLLWSIGAAALVAGVATTVLVMRVRQRRRLAALSSELARRNAELQELARSRARLLTAACHDLRQPAHALGLSAELAMIGRAEGMASGGTEETRRRLHSIWRNSVTLTDMLGELMDQTRLAGGNYPVQREPVSLQQLLADVQLQFTDQARRKGLLLRVDECALSVTSDRHLLRRVCFNLVSNAVKYTVQGEVHVSATALPRGQVRLTVSDTGPGIAPEHLASVFQDYVRADAGSGQEGLGIGLAIVKRAADLLGHAVELRSEVGQGTMVSLTLEAAAVTGLQLPWNATTARPGSQQWLAVLEDDAESRSALVALLHQWGYRTVEAASAAELATRLQALGLQGPDLLVTDLHLGTLDGLEQALLIRAWPGCAQLPVVLITGDLDTSVADRAAALGITVGHKPIVPRRLLPLIQAALHREVAA